MMYILYLYFMYTTTVRFVIWESLYVLIVEQWGFDEGWSLQRVCGIPEENQNYPMLLKTELFA